LRASILEGSFSELLLVSAWARRYMLPRLYTTLLKFYFHYFNVLLLWQPAAFYGIISAFKWGL
jgi:hypothetical protein